MEFYEVVNTRRSVRTYKPDPIPDDVMRRILDAARVAPSGSNRQPWRYVLVKNPDVRKKVANLCGGQTWIASAPLVVVACGLDIHYDRGGYMGPMSFLLDSAIGLTHLMLAARVEGVGCCWIGLFDNDAIRDLLDIPPDWNVAAVMPMGYPKEPVWGPTAKRKTIEEITSVDQWF